MLTGAALWLTACLPGNLNGDLATPAPFFTLIPLLNGTSPVNAAALTPLPENTPTPTPTADPLASPTLPPSEPIPPRSVVVTAPDGVKLIGTFYQGAAGRGPVVVLVHQARGTQMDWWEMGYVQYLRNQGEAGPTGGFISLPEGVHFSVFTFDLRGHGQSKGEYDPENAVQFMADMRAALEAARALPEVDPAQVAAIGSSTGSAVVFRCADLCAGVMSISLYPSETARRAIEALDAQGAVVFCVSEFPCPDAAGEHYTKIQYSGAGHGYDLLNPALDPAPGAVLLDFLRLTFGIEP